MDDSHLNNRLSEEDTKNRYITPALEKAGWDVRHDCRMEYRITDGRIDIHEGIGKRNPNSVVRADYVLFHKSRPIAVIEAKDVGKSVTHGLQQAMEYAQKIGAPFAYSSNGMGFAEHNFTTGEENQFDMDAFPSPKILFDRYRMDKNLNDAQIRMIEQPFYTGEYAPRYYQRRAVNETLDAIARGQERLLLVLATGTGKTFIAFQIVYRLLKAGFKKKILYLADRNILVDQSIQQDFAPLSKVTHKIEVSKETPDTITAYQVYFALYQQLTGDNGEEDHYSKLFNKDFFDLIIVDECHRGSAREDSSWRRILEYFSSATQIGMTATPKETRYASNINYFGEPIYTYSLNDGICDGYLAPFKVISYKLNIGEGWRPEPGQKDKNGQLIEEREYTNSDYDTRIIIEERTKLVAREITRYLVETDNRMAKTIVFTPNEDAADRMRQALINENKDLVKEHPDYVVRITGSDVVGKDKLQYFISVSAKFPVIATTSKLLSTGVDCKMVKVIVLDEMIGSMTEFKQIIGRGTRLREKEGKTCFVVLDFRGVTRLFEDPDWDGPIDIDEGFEPGSGGGRENKPKVPPERPYKPVIDKDGCRVEVTQKEVRTYDPSDSRVMHTESIIDYTKRNILGEYASLDMFINEWNAAQKKEVISKLFKDKGVDFDELKESQGMADVDDFDFIRHIAYGVKPLTRRERAERVKKQDFFSRYNDTAKEILEALLDKYMDGGVREIENIQILKLDPFTKYGSTMKIANYFGGANGYRQAVKALEQALYSGDAA